jgi:hypothetical protein
MRADNGQRNSVQRSAMSGKGAPDSNTRGGEREGTGDTRWCVCVVECACVWSSRVGVVDNVVDMCLRLDGWAAARDSQLGPARRTGRRDGSMNDEAGGEEPGWGFCSSAC